MARALVVEDVQNDFCEGGSLAVAGGATVAAAISGHIKTHGDDYDLIVATRDAHVEPGEHFSDSPDYVNSWPRHCVVGTPGQEFHSEFVPARLDAVFDKGDHEAAYSGFEGHNAQGIGLDAYLRAHGVTRIDCVGIATDYCVKATASDAAKLGYNTHVLLAFTAAVNPTELLTVTTALKAAGVTVE